MCLVHLTTQRKQINQSSGIIKKALIKRYLGILGTYLSIPIRSGLVDESNWNNLRHNVFNCQMVTQMNSILIPFPTNRSCQHHQIRANLVPYILAQKLPTVCYPQVCVLLIKLLLGGVSLSVGKKQLIILWDKKKTPFISGNTVFTNPHRKAFFRAPTECVCVLYTYQRPPVGPLSPPTHS